MHGLMGAWDYWCKGYGCMGLWMHGFMGAWIYECMGLWVHGFTGAWDYESRLREHVSRTYKLKLYSIFGNHKCKFWGYRL